MDLGGVEMAMADQFTGVQQHRNLMAVFHAHGRIAVDVDHLDGYAVNFRERRQRRQQLLA